MSNNLVVGERLKELRQQMGMTQPDAMEALERKGVTIAQSHMSNLENGTKLPSLPLLAALAQVYETSVDYLLGLTDNQLSARDMERELRTGGVSGRIGQIMADLSDKARSDLLAIAEAFAYQEIIMDVVLGRIQELGGDAALRETVDILEASRPSITPLLLGGRRRLTTDKPVQQQ